MRQSTNPKYWRIEIKPRTDSWEDDTGRTLFTPVTENATRYLAMSDVGRDWHVHSAQGVE